MQFVETDKSVNSKRYEGKKSKLFAEYLTALRQHTLLHHLAEIDPETKTPNVFSVCAAAGVKSEDKWLVLNASLVQPDSTMTIRPGASAMMPKILAFFDFLPWLSCTSNSGV
jgi:hypothetical protein